jgi:hypothetical protein
VLRRTLKREDERGKKMGGAAVMGHPIKVMRQGVRDGPRGGELGEWGQRDDWVAWCGRQQPGRGARGWRTRGHRATGAETGEGGG